MAGTKFSDYLGLKQYKNAKKKKFNPIPQFLGAAEAYFVGHIGPIFQIPLIYVFIGCP
jgi:hypothetical protein